MAEFEAVLAAGIKQLAPVGQSGEIIYGLFDP